ncbi:MAG TPA: hypothetical protein VLB80_03680 [Candidatus Babeliales bacterium]|nr:hypothetical protein [Candidatus Babeliales bacterium]
MSMNYNHVVGLFCIMGGLIIIITVLGTLLFKLFVGLAALSLINYGLRLRGLPPLQLLLPLMASRKRWF